MVHGKNDQKFGKHRFRRGRKRLKNNKQCIITSEPAIPKIMLIGNPNVGKSVIFYYLTGKYACVSNYPGTTVEFMRGANYVDNVKYDFIDTPGIYNLSPLSEDEKVTKKVLLDEIPDIIIQVGDAKNLRRTILFTFQLLELGIPIILVLNMMDEAKSHNIKLDIDGLSEELGIPVTGAIAIEKVGIGKIRKYIHLIRTNKPVVKPYIRYTDKIEELITNFEQIFEDNNIKCPISPRSVVLSLLEDDKVMFNWIEINVPNNIRNQLFRMVEEVKNAYSRPLISVISEIREEYAEKIVNKYSVSGIDKRESKFKIDITIHKVWGPIIAIGVMLLVFLFVGYVGAVVIVDLLSTYIFTPYSEFVNNGITILLNNLAEPWRTHLINILAGDLGLLTAGISWTIGLILPIVSIFYLAFAILEDSGYLSRVAIVSDRLANKMGLNGKAIIPIILGLGCGTSAIMTTRILDSRKERIISSLLIALAIPCSAQLGIIIGLMFQVGLQWALIVLLIVVSQLFIIGYLANKIIPGEKSKFIIEVPPMRMPKLSNVYLKTWMRTKAFLKEAIPLFFIGILLISILNETNAIQYVNNLFEPITVYLLGLPKEAAALWLLGVIRRDLGAAALFNSPEFAGLSSIQYSVGTTLIILFVPCIAAILIMFKERGIKNTLLILGFVFFYSIFISSILNFVLTLVFG